MEILNTNILFAPLEPNDTSEGGLLIPDSCKKVSNKGIVADVGKGVTKVNKGDIVFRIKDVGTEIEVEGKKCFFIDENLILAKL